jgi:hypothetical protein
LSLSVASIFLVPHNGIIQFLYLMLRSETKIS